MTNICRQHESPTENQAGLAYGLFQLLPANFTALQGCYAEAGGIGLNVRSGAPGSPDTVDLEVHLFPLRLHSAADLRRRAPESPTFVVLTHQLGSTEMRHRAAACQTLGQLGDPSVTPALLRVASEDPEPFVQQVAQRAVVDLEMPDVGSDSLANIPLCLECQPPGGPTMKLGPVETDSHGGVFFRGVPQEASCQLGLPDSHSNPQEHLSELAQSLDGLTFNEAGPMSPRVGRGAIEVHARPADEPGRFCALIRFRPWFPSGASKCFPKMAACRQGEFWSPTVIEPAAGVAWFNRLPRGGDYVTRVSSEWTIGGTVARRRPLYALDSALLARGLAHDMAAGAQILHPPDQRLLAIIECERRGAVMLTIETEATELKQARVRYSLGEEHGELRIAGDKSSHVWRGSQRLQQRYRGDEATRIIMQVTPHPTA